MTQAVSGAIAVQNIVDDVMRRDRGRLMAGLIARLGDFQRAEDALHEAVIAALKNWAKSGPPDDPVAWLMRVGLNKGIDQIRARNREIDTVDDVADAAIAPIETHPIPDERLRLIFTCCHPALGEKSRVALTLRIVCNLTTREIAAGFLDSEQTMGQRLSRAKAKIKSKRIPFATPEPDQWADRLGTVLSTIYLIFTTGYVTQDTGPRDLCREGIFLARLLRDLRPNEPEIEAALALMLLTDARRMARIDQDGVMVPVEDQDQRLWRQDDIGEAQDILNTAILRRQPGPFQIKAAIADCHMMRPAPDWHQMALLYHRLWGFEPTPIVALNWAVVIAQTGHVTQALDRLDALEPDLSDFQPWHAARAHMLARLGQTDAARRAYAIAIKTAPNSAARRLLEEKSRPLSEP